jgi:cytidylate kinase
MNEPQPLVVAIDGPSGVGKSSVARRLAARLGVPFVDTGAMYRALGYKALRLGIDPADRPAVARLAEETNVQLGWDSRRAALDVLLDGVSVTRAIRSPGVADATSKLAQFPEVRTRMVDLQRAMARDSGAVMEGRDIGTRVFPETPYKFFLNAEPAVRHERRRREKLNTGELVSLETVATEMARRDERDSSREDSPLRWDASYTVVDTSELALDQVVEVLLRCIRERAPVARKPAGEALPLTRSAD